MKHSPEEGGGVMLTGSQRAAATAGDRDIWLTAGAGSGKTRVLTERYLHLHIERSIPIGKILAITFTEKAASEMRERIGKRLMEKGLGESLHELPHAPISTIDSFCYRLLREYADRAGVEPGLRVLDEVEAEERQERIWVDLLDRWWVERREEAHLLFKTLAWKTGPDVPGGIDPRPLFSLVRAVRTAGRSLEDLSFHHDFGGEDEKLWAEIRGLFGEAETLLRSGLTAGTNRTLEALLSLRGIDLTGDADWLDPVREIRERLKLNISVKAKKTVHDVRDLLDRLIPIGEELDLEMSRTLLKELAIQFHRKYVEEKRTSGTADFLDLEEAACRLLQDESVGAEVRSRFRYLLLDECQDTNELQLGIVNNLRNSGRFLAVGDAKQSIYAFRDADVSAFLRMGEQLPAGTNRIPLDQNFRSRPEILRCVNTLFPRIWGANEQMGVRYEELTPGEGKEFTPVSDPVVEVLVVVDHSLSAARKKEAALLAGRLKQIHEEGIDGLHYGEMALLFRSATDIGLYESALRREGIPVSMAVGRGFFQTREVTDLLVGLSLVEDPHDDLRFASALRSPLAGMHDADLAAILADRLPVLSPLWERVRSGGVMENLSPVGRETLDSFTGLLIRLRDLRGRLPPFRLLEMLIEKTGYVDSLLMQPDGLRLRANVCKLVDIARGLEARAELSLPEAIRTLERYRYTRVRERESALDEERDAVCLTTVHSAKGREFPLVAVVDLGRPFQERFSPFLFHKTLGVGLKKRESASDPYLYNTIRESLKRLQRAEETRLLYVALTRAERRLLIAGSGGKRLRGWIGALHEAMELPESPGVHNVDGVVLRLLDQEGDVEERSGAPITPTAVLRSPARFTKGVDPVEKDRLLKRIVSEPLKRSVDRSGRIVTAVHSFGDCPRRYHLGRMFPIPDESGEENASLSLGTLFHRLMECSFHSLPDPEFGGGEEEYRSVQEWRENFLALPGIGERFRQGAGVAELAFHATVGGRPLRGAVDLLLTGDRDWMVIDYKTDRASPEEILERYRDSLNLYRLALLDIAGKETPVGASIYAAREGRLIPVPVDDEEALARLGNYDRAEREDDFPPRRNRNCSRCLYRRGCPAMVASHTA